MNKLSDKSYWSQLHTQAINRSKNIRNTLLPPSFHDHEYFNIVKKYIKPTHKTILEIGCAPGTQLIKICRRFNLIPYGAEYTKIGIALTKKNLKNNQIYNSTIFYTDIFNKKFQKDHHNQFDIVFSNGFIEHFDNLKEVIDAHIHLTKINGIVIIGIPNLVYLNKYLLNSSVKKIINFNATNIKYLKKNIPPTSKLEYLNYYGFFNWGLFFFRNSWLEFIRLSLFTIQRLFIDPVLIFCSENGLKITGKYISSDIIIIVTKIK